MQVPECRSAYSISIFGTEWGRKLTVEDNESVWVIWNLFFWLFFS